MKMLEERDFAPVAFCKGHICLFNSRCKDCTPDFVKAHYVTSNVVDDGLRNYHCEDYQEIHLHIVRGDKS